MAVAAALQHAIDTARIAFAPSLIYPLSCLLQSWPHLLHKYTLDPDLQLLH